MKKSILFIFFCGLSGVAYSGQESVVSRKDLEPKDAATVKSLEAQRWIGFGVNQQAKDNIKTKNGIGSGVNCTTNVGSAAKNSFPHPLGNSKTQPDVVVVTGDVINVCG
ncbi:hypothetical protein [Klebsiella aerogenes]|uniref:hypothetical protein n=1 Tax=Klebsiella aerogenes TaxID=548 RepID=UPI000AC9BA16|nr:hypothetical protein [Klebsiella aerogenes]